MKLVLTADERDLLAKGESRAGDRLSDIDDLPDHALHLVTTRALLAVMEVTESRESELLCGAPFTLTLPFQRTLAKTLWGCFARARGAFGL